MIPKKEKKKYRSSKKIFQASEAEKRAIFERLSFFVPCENKKIPVKTVISVFTGKL